MLRTLLVMLAAAATLLLARTIAAIGPESTNNQLQIVGQVSHVDVNERVLKLTTGERFILGPLDPRRRATGERVLISYEADAGVLRAKTIKRLHEQEQGEFILKSKKAD